MSTKPKPYQAYVSSPVPWFSDMPKHWGVLPMKMLFDERQEKGFPNEPLLAATKAKGVIHKSDYKVRTVTAQKNLHSLQLVEQGDFVISLRSFQGGIEISHARGIISPAYTVLSPRENINHGYFRYLLKSSGFIRFLKLFVTGIREGQNIDYRRLKKTIMPSIPLKEQATISQFLDWENDKIDGAISEKENLIKLLAEKRQVVIHNAVTRGLNSSIPLKSAGIAGLGCIPNHWKVMQLKYWVKTKAETTPENTDPDFEFDYVDIGTVGYGTLAESPTRMQFANAPTSARRIVRNNDTIVSTVRIYLRGVFTFKEIQFPTLASTALAVLRPVGNTSPDFVGYIAQSDYFINQAIIESKGIGYPVISDKRLSNILVAVPPNEEQEKIALYLGNATTKIDAAIDVTKREVKLLHEYRERLISDAVTGKIDLREFVPPAHKQSART